MWVGVRGGAGEQMSGASPVQHFTLTFLCTAVSGEKGCFCYCKNIWKGGSGVGWAGRGRVLDQCNRPIDASKSICKTGS